MRIRGNSPGGRIPLGKTFGGPGRPILDAEQLNFTRRQFAVILLAEPRLNVFHDVSARHGGRLAVMHNLGSKDSDQFVAARTRDRLNFDHLAAAERRVPAANQLLADLLISAKSGRRRLFLREQLAAFGDDLVARLAVDGHVDRDDFLDARVGLGVPEPADSGEAFAGH